ncbi:hypothetical protein NDU88_012319, partial [Pleurodeles waltl]
SWRLVQTGLPAGGGVGEVMQAGPGDCYRGPRAGDGNDAGRSWRLLQTGLPAGGGVGEVMQA